MMRPPPRLICESSAWHPSNLDPASYSAVFPFSGADTVYAIMVNHLQTVAGPRSFSCSVTQDKIVAFLIFAAFFA